MPLSGPPAAAVLPAEWQPEDYALKTWSYSPDCFGSTAYAPGSATLFVQRHKLRAATPVTGIVMMVGNAGSGLTAGQNWVGLYTASGTRLDATAAESYWTSGGEKRIPFAGGVQQLAAGDYYTAGLCNGTTAPTFHKASATGNINLGLTAANYRSGSLSAGTTLPDPMGTPSSAAVAWMGLY